MRHLGAVVILVSLGCGDAKVPVEPTPPPVAPALQDFQLSGAVSDTANRPLAGSKVEVVDGSRAGTVATTDESGRFSMPGTFTGNITLRASKDGYIPETRLLFRPGPPLPPGNAGGAWGVAFHLEPLGPSANLAGEYTLTLTADRTCSNLPAEARTRTYTATIVPSFGSQTSFTATLSDARFFSTVPCPVGRPPETCSYNRLGIGVAGDYASISAAPVEQLSETTYLAFTAGSEGVFGPTGITAPMHGSFLYCPSEPYQIDQGTWACPGSGGVECDSDNHQLTLVRR
jgi:hypothetical protein